MSEVYEAATEVLAQELGAMIARAEKAERERDALQGAFGLMTETMRDTCDKLVEAERERDEARLLVGQYSGEADKAEATIERVEALAVRWRINLDDVSAGFANVLEAALKE